MITWAALPAGGLYRGRVFCNDGQTLLLDDLYAGKVWLCAGQSNMAMSLSSLVPEDQPVNPDCTVVRFANIKASVSGKPKENFDVQWRNACGHVTEASAVGYHFARELGRQLGVPVGFIQAAVGHTPAMSWTRRERTPPHSFAATMLETFDQLAAQDQSIEETSNLTAGF